MDTTPKFKGNSTLHEFPRMNQEVLENIGCLGILNNNMKETYSLLLYKEFIEEFDVGIESVTYPESLCKQVWFD